jgi:Ca2+-binding EF-hand superfamily protein
VNVHPMKKIHSALLVLFLAAATTLPAQTTTPSDAPRGPHGGPGRPGGRGHGGHPIIRAIDTDKDGTISASELASAPAAIRALDTNGDGTVSAAELRPARPANAPTPPANAPTPPAGVPSPDGNTRPHPVDPVMLALDANGDGALSAAEINNASTSLAALDLNKDGKLTPDEMRPLPPAN